jgi:hypothetical protein
MPDILNVSRTRCFLSDIVEENGVFNKSDKKGYYYIICNKVSQTIKHNDSYSIDDSNYLEEKSCSLDTIKSVIKKTAKIKNVKNKDNS